MKHKNWKLITGIEVAIEYWGDLHRMVIVRQEVDINTGLFTPGYHHHNYPIKSDVRLERAHQLQKLLMHSDI
jgi:hypothetical protein